jgi:uncharacterized protein YjbI with pentapeptide repeats
MEQDQELELKNALEDSSSHNSGLMIFFLGFMVYILLAVASTTDLQLLVPDSIVNLPVLNVELPLFQFYSVTPLLVIVFHFNFLFNLLQHCIKLNEWNNKRGKDNVLLLFPFIFNYLIQFKKGQLSYYFLRIIIWIITFFLPLFILTSIQWRFSDYHDLLMTFWHLISILLDIFLLSLFWHRIIFSEFSGQQNDTFEKIWYFHTQKGFLTPITKILKLLKISFLYIFTGKLNITISKLPFFVIKSIREHCYIKEVVKEIHKRSFIFEIITIWLIIFISLFNLILIILIMQFSFISGIDIFKAITPKLNLSEKELVASPPSNEIIQHYLARKETENSAKYEAWKEFGQGLTLSGRDLKFANFYKSNFMKADLRKAKLQNANLEEADLQNANLEGAELQSANLTRAKLQEAIFSQEMNLQKSILEYVDLQNVKLQKADLQEANLFGAKLQGADLSEAKLQGADLREAELQGADLRGANLQGANLSGAKLQGVSFSIGAELQSVDLSGADLRGDLRGIDLTEADLRGADLSEAKLQGATLREAKLQGADLSEAELQGADLTKAKLQGADLKKANLQEGADLSEANLQDADLSGANLQRAYLTNTELQYAYLVNAKLQGADLSKANLQGADLTGAELQGSDLKKANLQGADLSEANLQGADLTAVELQIADLKKANLQGADLSEAKLQGADLWDTKLQGVHLTGAKLKGASFDRAIIDGIYCEKNTLDWDTGGKFDQYEDLLKDEELLSNSLRNRFKRLMGSAEDRINKNFEYITLEKKINDNQNLSKYIEKRKELICADQNSADQNSYVAEGILRFEKVKVRDFKEKYVEYIKNNCQEILEKEEIKIAIESGG